MQSGSIPEPELCSGAQAADKIGVDAMRLAVGAAGQLNATFPTGRVAPDGDETAVGAPG